MFTRFTFTIVWVWCQHETAPRPPIWDCPPEIVFHELDLFTSQYIEQSQWKVGPSWIQPASISGSMNKEVCPLSVWNVLYVKVEPTNKLNCSMILSYKDLNTNYIIKWILLRVRANIPLIFNKLWPFYLVSLWIPLTYNLNPSNTIYQLKHKIYMRFCCTQMQSGMQYVFF